MNQKSEPYPEVISTPTFPPWAGTWIPSGRLATPPEYRQLLADLTPHVVAAGDGNLSQRLPSLREDEERQDTTYLAHKTGWDASLVAMTALASQFSARTGIAPEFLAPRIPEALQHFENERAARLLDEPPPLGISTLREACRPSWIKKTTNSASPAFMPGMRQIRGNSGKLSNMNFPAPLLVCKWRASWAS